jgi:CRP-like cAMP-binding protein
MSGQVIQTLGTSPLLAALTEAELAGLANCGRTENYRPGQTILKANREDERVFILRQGRVKLHLGIRPESGQCGGEAQLEFATPGAALGWATWVHPDRILISAHALEPTTLVALDLNRLRDAQTSSKVGQQMVQRLYEFLLVGGVCSPAPQGLLRQKARAAPRR